MSTFRLTFARSLADVFVTQNRHPTFLWWMTSDQASTLLVNTVFLVGGVQPPSQDKWITCITFCGIGFPTQQNSWTKNRWNMAEQYGSHVIFPNGRGVSSPCAWEFGPRHALAGVTRPRKPGDRRIG